MVRIANTENGEKNTSHGLADNRQFDAKWTAATGIETRSGGRR
jgi:hypothetical protein